MCNCSPTSNARSWPAWLGRLPPQVELHRKAAEAARDALAAKDQQVKELTREGAKADKDRWAAATSAAAGK